MKILIRSNKAKNWKSAESIKTKGEVELQNLLAESPSLIPVDEIREEVSHFVFAVHEFGLPGSGSTDVLAFNPSGDIAIIECKLATNPESKRKVIGQIFEYAAYLWNMSYEEVDSRVQRLKGKGLWDSVAEVVKEGWDEESFRSGVKQSLESGSFILIIAVDEINEDLKRTVRYLNECSKSTFSLHALEMRRFQSDDIEILVPHLHGISPRPPESPKKEWTEKRYFDELNKYVEPEVVNTVRELYEWARNIANLQFGRGKRTGSFTLCYLVEGKITSVFTIYTNGVLSLNYGALLSHNVDEKTLDEFHNMIHKIPAFEYIPADFTKWPEIKASDAFLNQSKAVEKFKEAVLWLKNKIHSEM